MILRFIRHYRVAVASAVLLTAGLASGQAHDGGAVGTDAERIEVASGNAHRGPWRMNESDFDYVDDPAVAITDEGTVGVVWADQPRRNIFFQRYGAHGQAQFDEPVNVSSHPGIFSWLPRLVIASHDPQWVYVLWQEIVFRGGSHGGEIFFARSDDGGATFSEAINLSDSVAGAGKGRLTRTRWSNGSLDLAEGPDGQLYAAWSEYEGRLWVSRSHDSGASFAAPVHVAGDQDRPARAPALAVGSGGSVHLAWTVGEDAAADIHLATSLDGGRSFGEPEIVAPGDGHADAPKIAVDSQERLHLVYGESPGGPFQRYRIRYAHRDGAGKPFIEPRTIASPHTSLGSVNFPHLAVDAADRLYVVWELFRDYRHRPHGLGFTISPDAGQTFAEPQIVPGSDVPDHGFTANLQGFLTSKLAVNAEGALALVNPTYAPEQASRIWLWRSPSGKFPSRH